MQLTTYLFIKEACIETFMQSTEQDSIEGSKIKIIDSKEFIVEQTRIWIFLVQGNRC